MVRFSIGTTIAIFLPLLWVPESHALQVRWLGVAGLYVSDQESTLLIDPVFTKPGLKNWFFNSRFVSDPDRVESGLKAAGVVAAQAIFVSHEHFDHAVDAAQIGKKTGARVYGGDSLRKIVTADSQVKPVFIDIQDGIEIQVGRFKVIPYLRDHPPIFHLDFLRFLPGAVPSSFDFRFYDYHEGEVWGFRIEHPEADLLIDQSSRFFEANHRYAGRTDAHFVGVANKESLDALVERNILRIKSPRVIPIHFDFFLLQSKILEKLNMPGMDLDEIQKRLMMKAPGVSFEIPKPNQIIEIKKK